MNDEELDAVLRKAADEVDHRADVWQLVVRGVTMACITDTEHDRLRLVAPIIATEDMARDQCGAVMEANFHTALDARYATSDGVLYAIFLHPLEPLTEALLLSAIAQVRNLVRTYGRGYTSGVLAFDAVGP